jgi:diguanylate cyclase (GGDEF)-like protein
MEICTMTEIDGNLLQNLPTGLVLLSPDGAIRWVNETLCRMLNQPAETLVGRQPDALPEGLRRTLATEPRIFSVDGSEHWVSRERLSAADGSAMLVLTDVSSQEQLASENARLRQQIEDLKLTDDLTGLPNRRAISQSLDLHISRSRRYQNPLSVVLVSADMDHNAAVQPLTNEPQLLAVSRFLRDRLRWVDQIARWNDTVFLLVLPETTETDARGLLEKIAREQHTMLMPGIPSDQRPRLSFGLACWQKGDDMRTLLRSAVEDLQKGNGG